jgi:hypothetical protein
MPGGIHGMSGGPGSPQVPEDEGSRGEARPSEPRISDVPYMTGDFHAGASQIYGKSSRLLKERAEAWRRSQAEPGILRQFAHDVLKLLRGKSPLYVRCESFLLRVIDKLRGGNGSPPAAPAAGGGAPSGPSSPPSSGASAPQAQRTQISGYSYPVHQAPAAFQFQNPNLVPPPIFRTAVPNFSRNLFVENAAVLCQVRGIL